MELIVEQDWKVFQVTRLHNSDNEMPDIGNWHYFFWSNKGTNLKAIFFAVTVHKNQSTIKNSAH